MGPLCFMNRNLICLGKPEGENYGGLLRMLEVLFGGRCTPRQVIQILEDEYEFSDIHSMERTVSEMCNLSQGFIEEGRKQGLAQGIEYTALTAVEVQTGLIQIQNWNSCLKVIRKRFSMQYHTLKILTLKNLKTMKPTYLL